MSDLLDLVLVRPYLEETSVHLKKNLDKKKKITSELPQSSSLFLGREQEEEIGKTSSVGVQDLEAAQTKLPPERENETWKFITLAKEKGVPRCAR